MKLEVETNMYSLFQKEIKIFLGSLTGYLVIIVFLLVTGLFLWVFPGIYNIPGNGYATLEGLFMLAPWVYLFLVPAITMRSFADEKRTGTIEMLLTHPVGDIKIVFAKFLAGMVLVVFSLFPALLWFLSVWLLGNPVGNIDTGATWGSFAGLFFLAAIYVAIGVFASSLTDNQIVSFITAMAVSFVFYQGFDFISASGVPYFTEQFLTWFSINNHYQSISRGVIDLRDMVYFAGMAFLFIYLTTTLLRKENLKNRKTKKRTVVTVLGLFVLFFVSTNFLYRIDLTSDKRYSLAAVSKEIASGINETVEIELYLAGELEPGLQKLQQEVFEKTAVLNIYTQKPIRIRLVDVYQITNPEKRAEFQNKLFEKGIKPVNFNRKTEQGLSSRFIYPGAVVRLSGKEVAVNFLQNNPDFSYEANFNHSIESVEFELTNAFRKLQRTKKPTVAILEGHGEFNRYELMDFTNALSPDFNVVRTTTQQMETGLNEIEILIVAGPKHPFTEKDKFIIDQLIMNGVKVTWLIDPVLVSLDSLSSGYQTFSFPLNLNLDDMLFKYGVRINYELLQDVDCARILVNTAPAGSQVQWTLHPWYYSPLLTPSDNHPLSRNLNRVYTEFVSSVDTLSGNKNLKKYVILTTSPYARRVKSPSSVSLENIKNPPARELFTQSFIPVGVLVEGEFTSVFENRMVENLGVTGNIVAKSPFTKMVVFADAGLAANKVNYSKQPPAIMEMGYDRVSKQTFGNKEFLLNTIYYLNDDSEIMQLRNRTLKLRLLDKVKLREEKKYWQWVNILAPLVLVLLFGLVYNLVRIHRYSRL